MRPKARRLLLMGLALIVLVGCIVPSVFHDEWTEGRTSYRRNRITGDRIVTHQEPSWGFCCFGGSRFGL